MTEDLIEMRDRLARAEQDIKNHKETFHNFKTDDFVALKQDVHQMRAELNDKVDALMEKVSIINVTMAKWAGGFAVLMFLAEAGVRYLYP